MKFQLNEFLKHANASDPNLSCFLGRTNANPDNIKSLPPEMQAGAQMMAEKGFFNDGDDVLTVVTPIVLEELFDSYLMVGSVEIFDATVIVERRDGKSGQLRSINIHKYPSAAVAEKYAALFKKENYQDVALTPECLQVAVVFEDERGPEQLNDVNYSGQSPTIEEWMNNWFVPNESAAAAKEYLANVQDTAEHTPTPWQSTGGFRNN